MYEQLGAGCVQRIGSYMPPGSLSRFRNVNRFHRRGLKSVLVDALVAATLKFPTVAPAFDFVWHDECPFRKMREAALCALPKIAEKGDAGAIAAVSACLEHWDDNVRYAAQQAFFSIVEKGCACAIAAVSARLENANRFVREEAVYVLSKITGKGDAGAIAAMSARLEDADPGVRNAARLATLQLTWG